MSFRRMRPGEELLPGDLIVGRQFGKLMWKDRVTRVTRTRAVIKLPSGAEIAFKRVVTGFHNVERIPRTSGFQNIFHEAYREVANG